MEECYKIESLGDRMVAMIKDIGKAMISKVTLLVQLNESRTMNPELYIGES